MNKIFFICFVALGWTWMMVHSSPAPFRLCDSSVKQQNNTLVRIDVSDCEERVSPIPPETANETCPLIKGTSHNFTIHFVPNVTTQANLERVIIASFATDKPDGPLEIPYGGAVNAGLSTVKESSGQLTKDVGLESGSMYIHNNMFPVLATAPKTSLVVRYIIREKLGGTKKRANWKAHKGNTIICVEIPVTLVDNPNATTPIDLVSTPIDSASTEASNVVSP